MEPFNLKVWKCHKNSCRVESAERTLKGTAHEGGLKFCGPYTYANKSGFWMYPAVDVDICWHGGSNFEVKLHQEFDNSDAALLRSLLTPTDDVHPDVWCPAEQGRNKFSWGTVDEGVVQFWTGNIFETPPGWSLHIRSPINFPTKPCHVMEGILETDWMQQDIWANVVFDRKDEWVQFRTDTPFAQLVPVRRESYAEKWQLSEEIINRDTPEANRVFEYWTQFNEKKFAHGGKQVYAPDRTKDATTYYKEKQRMCGGQIEPKPEMLKCPFHKPNRTVVYVLNDTRPRHPVDDWPKHDYVEMGLTSLRMLREHNKNIPVKIILINSQYREVDERFQALGATIIHKTNHPSDRSYFPMNKCWVGELEEDQVLYLDVDTFVNGDVADLFSKYDFDYTAAESKWIHQKGWKMEFLPGSYHPQNSGVQLFKKGFHKIMFSRLPEALARLNPLDFGVYHPNREYPSPLAEWVWSYANGWTREEVAASLVAAESGVKAGYFWKQDVYNIQRPDDVNRCRESLIFHSYSEQWKMVNKWLANRRKMVWPGNTICDKQEYSQKGVSDENPGDPSAQLQQELPLDPQD